MDHLPAEAWALLLMVLGLGMRHGLDADHLATVDGLTRYNAGLSAPRARWAGLLFSLGHGAVVLLVASGVSVAAARWAVPAWLEDLGAAISIGFLLLLGALNLVSVWRAQPSQVVAPAGLRGRCFGRLARVSSPWAIVLVGALFALSFDTMSQAALLSLAATTHGGWAFALVLGLAFTAGMALVDAANGLWVSRLLARADRTACVASRVMGLAVGSLSLLVAGYGAARWLSPAVAAWSERWETVFGAAVVAVVVLSFATALGMTRAHPARA